MASECLGDVDLVDGRDSGDESSSVLYIRLGAPLAENLSRFASRRDVGVVEEGGGGAGDVVAGVFESGLLGTPDWMKDSPSDELLEEKVSVKRPHL